MTTMISPKAPSKEPETVPEATPYDPMFMLRVWQGATADIHVPGSNRYHEEPDAFGRMKVVESRMRLLREEFNEVMDELLDFKNGGGDRITLAKELADLACVLYGTADTFEIPLPEIVVAVHKSNMTKISATGRVERHEGKILKGPHYQEPDIASIIWPGVSS